MNQKLLKSQTILAICILILSIIPIVAIGPYLHQFADDYVFGAPVYKAWTATHSLGACIQAAWDESMHIYQTWQGTYSACFLMALQPGIFGKYWLVPIYWEVWFFPPIHWVILFYAGCYISASWSTLSFLRCSY